MTQVQNVPDPAHSAKCDLVRAVLHSSGTLRMRASGWSMLPTVWPRDVLVFDPVGMDAICCGDIVLFSRNRRFLSHRIVSKCEDGCVITQGDASPFPDNPPVAASELLGKVSFIVRDGSRIEPRRELSLTSRIAAETIRRSTSAARIFVGVHGMRQGLKGFMFACQS